MSKENKNLEIIHEFLKEQEKKDKNQDRCICQLNNPLFSN